MGRALSRRELDDYNARNFSGSEGLAEIYSVLGRKQEALQYLKAAYSRRADGVLGTQSNPAFNNLHEEPAFRRMLADIGLPPLR